MEIFDLKTREWSVLTSCGKKCGFPVWSRDSRSIYYYQSESDIPSGVVYKVPVTGGAAEPIADFPDFRTTGFFGFWFGLDQDENPLLPRDSGTDEVYALTLERR